MLPACFRCRSPKVGEATGEPDEMVECGKIAGKLVSILLENGASREVIGAITNDVILEYSGLLSRMAQRIARLNGKVEGLMAAKGSQVVPSVSMPAGAGISVAAGASNLPAVPKPTETWSVVVRSRNKEASPKELAQVVMREVAPALGVRVHTVNPLKSGGVALRVPSEKERKKVVENPKFSEHGLEVAVTQKLGPR